MLEIWLIMLLCKSVKNNAIERGRKPGGFIALAIVLWVIPEIVGLIIGYSLELEYASFLIAYGLVGIGAAISYNVAKHCKTMNLFRLRQTVLLHVRRLFQLQQLNLTWF